MKFDTIVKSNYKFYKRIRVYIDEYSRFRYAVTQKANYELQCEQDNSQNNRYNDTRGASTVLSKQLVDYYSVQSNYWSTIKSIKSKKRHNQSCIFGSI